MIVMFNPGLTPLGCASFGPSGLAFLCGHRAIEDRDAWMFFVERDKLYMAVAMRLHLPIRYRGRY